MARQVKYVHVNKHSQPVRRVAPAPQQSEGWGGYFTLLVCFLVLASALVTLALFVELSQPGGLKQFSRWLVSGQVVGDLPVLADILEPQGAQRAPVTTTGFSPPPTPIPRTVGSGITIQQPPVTVVATEPAVPTVAPTRTPVATATPTRITVEVVGSWLDTGFGWTPPAAAPAVPTATAVPAWLDAIQPDIPALESETGCQPGWHPPMVCVPPGE